MSNDNNFPRACKEYLQKRCIQTAVIEQLEQQNLISYEENKICFKMKDLNSDSICGDQERYLQKIILHGMEIKSKTSAGSKVGCLYERIPQGFCVLVEGEIDWLSVAHLPNVLGIQGIHNLKKVVEILKQRGIATIYLLVDRDESADVAIGKLLDMDDTFLSNVFDCRDILGSCKDVNDYLCGGGEITIDFIQIYAKSLGDFKKLTDTLLIKDRTIKINHNEFAKYMIKKFAIESTQKNLFIYDHGSKNGIWQPLDKEYAEKLIMQQLESLLSYIISHFRINDLNHTLDFMIAHANTEELKQGLLYSQSEKEINLLNGILNVETMEIRDYTKQDYKFQKLPYPRSVFDTYSEPKKFLEFLNEILEGSINKQEIIDFLQEFIGWLFVSNTRYEKALLVFGSGANGKGVLLSVIKELLGGSQNCSSIGLHEINKDQYLYNLIGKLVNIESDLQQNVQLDSGIIKKIVSGEVLSAKSVYQRPVEFKNNCRLLIATNELPYLKSIDNSIRRRFVFLHLKKSFYGKENPNLVNEILEKKNDIFVWAIEGLVRLLNRNNFLIPQELNHELENFVKENDTIELWFDDGEVERVENAKIHNKDIYPRYRMYCLDNGLRPLSKRSLNRRLRDKGFVEFKDQYGRGFEGIGLVDNRPF